MSNHNHGVGCGNRATCNNNILNTAPDHRVVPTHAVDSNHGVCPVIATLSNHDVVSSHRNFPQPWSRGYETRDMYIQQFIQCRVRSSCHAQPSCRAQRVTSCPNTAPCHTISCLTSSYCARSSSNVQPSYKSNYRLVFVQSSRNVQPWCRVQPSYISCHVQPWCHVQPSTYSHAHNHRIQYDPTIMASCPKHQDTTCRPAKARGQRQDYG